MAAATIAGIAPRGSLDLNWLAWMGKENIEEFGAALAGPIELRSYLERVGLTFAKMPVLTNEEMPNKATYRPSTEFAN
jgi:hypothetical protein